jgi:hypothetical protein
MYVLYEVPQAETHSLRVVLREAKQVIVPGRMVNYEVGEFRMATGRKVPGVRINYHHDETGTAYRVEAQIVEVPSHALNVRVIDGGLPDDYERAPGEAVDCNE